MFKVLFLLAIFSLVIISCGDDDEIPAAPIAGPAQDEDLTQFVSQMRAGSDIRIGDEVNFRRSYYYKHENGEYCYYQYSQARRIDDATNDQVIVFNTTNDDFVQNKYNSSECPDMPPRLSRNNSSSKSLDEIVQITRENIEPYFNPASVCTEEYSCVGVKITARYDVVYKGVNARYVEAELTYKSGKTYIRKSWIAKNSLLHGVFEYDVVNKHSGNWSRYKTFIP